MASKYVVVTTEYRGLFAGELVAEDGRKVTLANARCGIYWATTGGFVELAEKGPNAKSKIGAVAPEIVLHGVTSIARCTPEAEKAWKAR